MRHAPCGSPGPAHPLVLCSDVFLPLVSVYLANVRKKLRLSVKPYWKFMKRARGHVWWSNDSSSIVPWKMSNFHGDVFYSPRRKESFLPKYHLIVPKYYFFLTWRFFISSGEIWDLLGKYSHLLIRVSSRSLSDPVYKSKRDVHLPSGMHVSLLF